METLHIVEKIEDAYQTMNIYRSLIIYDDEEQFHHVQALMSAHDFTFASDDNVYGRVYALPSDWFEECIGNHYIDWNSIQVVFSIGEHAEYVASLFKENNIYVENVIVLQ